jgi:hypothetical protein
LSATFTLRSLETVSPAASVISAPAIAESEPC